MILLCRKAHAPLEHIAEGFEVAVASQSNGHQYVDHVRGGCSIIAVLVELAGLIQGDGTVSHSFGQEEQKN